MYRDADVHRLGETDPALRHSVRQGLAWMIAAELVRRHPGHCRVVEGHPHGYDCVTVIARSHTEHSYFSGWRMVIYLNKGQGGHLTTNTWLGSGAAETDERLNWVDVLMAQDLREDVVVPIEIAENLPRPAQTPETTDSSIGPRLLGALARRTMFTPRPWQLVSGMVDDDYRAEPREGLFAQFPWLSSHREKCRAEEPGFEPEWRFWFLIDEAGPVGVTDQKAYLAIDSFRGIAFTADKVIELLPEYRRLNGSIELLANAVCPPC